MTRRAPGTYRKPAGAMWIRFIKPVIAAHGGICHICGHGGARQADHVIPVSERPDLAWHIPNIRPAHGVPGNRCPTCGHACNQLRDCRPIEWARARVLVPPAPRRRRRAPAGRPW